MTPPPVLITRRIPDPALAVLRGRCRISLHDDDRPIPRDALLREAAGKHGVLTMLTDRIDREMLDAAGPELRVVANCAVGFDNVDIAACSERGVLVTNTPDVLTAATADFTWALILAASRRVVEGDRLMRTGIPWSWAPGFMLGREVSGKTLGLVGFGRIGQAVAARSRGFQMRVLYHSLIRKPDAEQALGAEHRDFRSLLGESDVVSCHVALTEETRLLFDARAFDAMKPTAVFVNTSRGAVVDEAALADALAEERIAAAGLDVFEREPAAHPSLLERENVVLTPHVASATVETRTAMAMAAAENLLAALDGKPPPAAVNPQAVSSRR